MGQHGGGEIGQWVDEGLGNGGVMIGPTGRRRIGVTEWRNWATVRSRWALAAGRRLHHYMGLLKKAHNLHGSSWLYD